MSQYWDLIWDNLEACDLCCRDLRAGSGSEGAALLWRWRLESALETWLHRNLSFWAVNLGALGDASEGGNPVQLMGLQTSLWFEDDVDQASGQCSESKLCVPS